MLKRLYDGVALFCLFNLLGLAGLTALLVSKETLTGEKLRSIAAILRGDEALSSAAGLPEESVAPNTETATAEAAQMTLQPDRDVQLMRLEAERIKAELDQRLALNNSILLRVSAERERLQQAKEATKRQRRQQLDKRQSEGFLKQIAIYDALTPKVAVEHLLALPDPDAAAGILLEMETRKAKKIVEAAKRGKQMEKMKSILQRIREVRRDRFDDLNAED